jgi:uncharacterized protein YxeA
MMKKILKIISLLYVVFILQSFFQIKAQNVVTNLETEYHELKLNEVDSFMNGPDIKYNDYNAYCKRGSYDNTRYRIDLDSTGELNVSDLRECKGKHQNEISIFNCSGTISRNSDTIIISAKTIYNKFFLFNIKKNGFDESFTPNIRIELISKTLNNEYCPSLVTTDDQVHIVALPKDIDTDEIYEPVHRDKTIGIFTYFAVYDSKGSCKFYPAGDYVLIGGNSIKISK